MIGYYKQARKWYEEWYEEWYQKQQHRDGDLPAIIVYHIQGQKIYEYWYQNGQLHRDGDTWYDLITDNMTDFQIHMVIQVPEYELQLQSYLPIH